VPNLHVRAGNGLVDGKDGAPSDDLGHQAAVAGVQVLDGDDGGAEGRRQAAEDERQRAQAASGGGDGHDRESGFVRA
jgi:hypothetical protein